MESNLNMNPTVATVIVCLVMLPIVGYFLARYFKGSLDILLQRTTLTPGETMRGRVRLVAKKSIQSNQFKVALVCREVITYRGGKRRRTHRNEIYRDEKVLEQGQQYPSKFQRDYNFEFPVPSPAQFGGESAGGFNLEIAGFHFGSPSRRIEWKVEAVLDAAGVDLSTARNVFVRA